MIKELALKYLAPFEEHNLKFSKVNIFIGKNSTGKSIIMKLLYSLIFTLNKYQDKKELEYEITKKIKGVFFIEKIGKLSTRIKGSHTTNVEMLKNDDTSICFTFSTRSKNIKLDNNNIKSIEDALYIPTKEIISMMDKGFIGLYDQYHFMEEIYYDLAKKLDKPLIKGRDSKDISSLLKKLKLGEFNRIYRKDKEYYVYIKNVGNLESKLIAEGYRKILMLIYLIKTGEFSNTKYLFWDEPEVNLNPTLSSAIIELLSFISESYDTQIFISTHDYFIMKYFTLKDLEKKFFSFYYDENNKLQIESANDLLDLEHNDILDEFEKIFRIEYGSN